MATSSRALPILIVSALVLSVPTLITSPWVLVPRLIMEPADPPLRVMSSVAVKRKSSVEVMVTSPVPDWMSRAWVVVAEPTVTVPVEVPVLMLVGWLMSLLIKIPPEPDCRVKVEVVPVLPTVTAMPARDEVSLADPMTIVSAVVSLVPTLIVFPPVPV